MTRADRKLSALLDSVAADLLKQHVDDAVRRLSAAQNDPALALAQAELSKANAVIQTVANMPNRILQSFAADIGETVTVDFREHPARLEIREVRADDIKAMVVIKREGTLVRIGRTFAVRDLSVTERTKRLGGDDAPAASIMRGLLAMEASRLDSAADAFERAGGRLGQALLRRLEQLQTAKPEVAVDLAFRRAMMGVGQAGQKSPDPQRTFAALTLCWVVPLEDRLSFVIPWDSKRRERARVCPPGETRQIWLDIDGHRLAPGSHSLCLEIKAEPAEAKGTGTGQEAKGTMPGRSALLANLRKLAGEEAQRNCWYHWGDNLKYQKVPLKRDTPFKAIVEQAHAREDKLPVFVVWAPSAWVDLTPGVLPPSLESVGSLPMIDLCQDECESACLTVTNLGLVPLRFAVTLAAPEAGAPQRRQDASSRLVELGLRVWPYSLPATARLASYSWNYANANAEHLAFLQRMKCNWFTLSIPEVKVENDHAVCDFKETDKDLGAVGKFGKKGVFIFKALAVFEKTLKEKHAIGVDDPRFQALLREYFTQWLQHMREKGWRPQDYAIQLWDEPGLGGQADQDRVFQRLKQAISMLREIEPGVQVFVNPLTSFRKEWYDLLAEYAPIWAPFGGLTYLKEDTKAKTWEEVKGLNPAVFAEGNLMTQVYLRRLRTEHGGYLWTYFQRPPATQNAMAYYRHFPWKNKWMGFDGVSFWSSWYATSGALKDPIYLGTEDWFLYAVKGLYGWRDGMEDVQYLEMLEDRVEALRGPDPEGAEALNRVLYEAQKRVADTGWWAASPQVLEDAVAASRRQILRALVPEGQ